MKKLLLGLMLLFCVLTFAQENVKRRISYDTISKYTINHLKLKGAILYDEYVSKDGSLYKIGDTIKINKPLSNGKFTFITDRFSLLPAESKLIGSLMIIKNIIVVGFKSSGYELCMTINNAVTTDQSLKFEIAMENGEIKSKTNSSDDALIELKRFKDKLDLGLISQKEFNDKRSELSKFIK